MAQMETDIQDPEVDILYCCPFTKQSAAHFQCLNGNVKLLKLLIKHNPEIAFKIDDDGNTLLHALVKVMISLFIFPIERRQQASRTSVNYKGPKGGRCL